LGYLAVIAIAAIVLLAAYLLYCVFVLTWLFAWLAGYACGLGFAAGAGMTLAFTALVLVGQGRQPWVFTPRDAVSRGLGWGVARRQLDRDPAWPQYFVRQVVLDYSATAEWSVAVGWQVWRKAWALIPRWRIYRDQLHGQQREPDSDRPNPTLFLVAFWPVLTLPATALVGMAAGVVAALILVALVFLAVTGVAWTSGLLVVGVQRAVDHGWQRLLGAEASCPSCYFVTELPAYRCPGSHPDGTAADRGFHRDLRPGWQGVWFRRCACGQRLPTNLLRAAVRLAVHCPKCTNRLQPGAAVVTDVRIAVFGAASAGKTQLVMSALAALCSPGARDGAVVSLLDEHGSRARHDYRARLEHRRRPEPTDPSEQPVAITIGIRRGRRDTLLHIFDAAGEVLVDPRRSPEMSYLDNVHGLLFVLDPLSVPGVLRRLVAVAPGLAGLDTMATHDPEDSYYSTVNRLRRYGVDTRRQRLAFVLSKADLLDALPAAECPDPVSRSVRQWLGEHDLDNLVRSAQRDFGMVEFFLCSAIDPQGTQALAPLGWLLTGGQPSGLPRLVTSLLPATPARRGDGRAQ
jgi:hypothetical protein